MSTSTQPDSNTLTQGTSTGTLAGTRKGRGWMLISQVFVAGACSLAVEVSASRLLAPYFGDTLFVWANLIGLILLYLTIGYYVGGRFADRYPSTRVFYTLSIVAAFFIALVPFIAQPVLSWTQALFASNPLGVFYGSLISVILLFVIPTILLGCVSPFAIRLSIEQTGSSGRIAGKLYAISTVGSMFGTFLPVLLFLPNIGTAKTFLTFGLALLLSSLLGLWLARAEQTGTVSSQLAQPARPRTSFWSELATYTPQTWMLIALVFVEGACALAVEISASRLLAPYFGTSLFIWAILIALILLYLTIGYYVGGRVADRHPSHTLLYGLTIAAAFLIALIPIIARPLMALSQSSFITYSVGAFVGSLGGTVLLFAAPVILLSCVSPFAIRLQVGQAGQPGTSGSIAGKLYAISTAGSIAGTFLPALVLIPTIGTYRTFFTFGLALLLISILGLFISGLGSGNGLRLPRVSVRLLSLLLLIPMIWSTLAIQGPIKHADGSNGGGDLLTERESPYNYIQVVKVGNETQLILNEGVGIHSIYDPDTILTGGPWDYFAVAPYFNNPPFTPTQFRNVCVIGLGAGTIPHELSAMYGPIPIDGVELDGEIVNLARQYFHMDEPNLHVIVQDGRYYLQSTQKKYDEIAIDAYQQPYVPFQLTTREFFQEVRAHLTPTGVTVINAGRTNSDFRLVETLAQTMHAVFPNVYIINTARFTNSIIIATNARTSLSNFAANMPGLTNQLLRTVASSSLQGNMREETIGKAAFTDDQAPVEQLIDSIILDEIEHPGS